MATRTKTAPRPRDAAATKARLLEAATAEFAQHGLAGARVDRIAADAGANKRLIYAYFGDKAGLFDAVIAIHTDALIEAVSFDPEDMRAYAGDLFDHLIARPELLRLSAWKNLERPRPSAAERHSYAAKLEAIGAAQKAGRLDDTFAPADLLAIMLGMVTSWVAVSGALHDAAPGAPFGRKRLTEHRAAIVEAVARATRAV